MYFTPARSNQQTPFQMNSLNAFSMCCPACVENNQAYFSVDFIMGHKSRTAKCHAETKRYLIKWAGYPVWENTEEPVQNIAGDVPFCIGKGCIATKNLMPSPLTPPNNQIHSSP